MWQRMCIVVALAGIVGGLVALGCSLLQASAALQGVMVAAGRVWAGPALRGGTAQGRLRRAGTRRRR